MNGTVGNTSDGIRSWRPDVMRRGMSMSIFVLSLGLITHTVAATNDMDRLTVGDEVVVMAGGDGVRGEPWVSTGGGVSLVAWREGWQGDGGASRICMARLDGAGKLLDAKPVAVAPDAAGVQDRPRVAFGGGCFLVVWQEFTGNKQYDVRAVRVSPQGKVLDARSLAIGVSPENDFMPAVASDGTNFLVAWQGAVLTSNSAVIHVTAATVSAAGEVGPAKRLFPGSLPAVAWNGKQYLVFGNGNVGVRIDASGAVLDAKPRMPWDGIGVSINYAMAGLPATGGWLFVGDRSQPDYWGWGGPGAIRCRELTDKVEVCVGLNDYHKAIEKGSEYTCPKGKLYDDWLDLGDSKKDGATWPIGQVAVCWDGKQNVVVWQRHHIEKSVLFANCDLMASRMDGWKGLDRAGVAVAASELSEKAPSLASDGAGNLVCAYEKYDKEGAVKICARTMVVK